MSLEEYPAFGLSDFPITEFRVLMEARGEPSRKAKFIKPKMMLSTTCSSLIWSNDQKLSSGKSKCVRLCIDV